MFQKEKDIPFYKDKLYGNPHTNYIGGDKPNPVIISVEETKSKMARAIVRTSEEDTLLCIPSSTSKEDQLKVFQYLRQVPDLHLQKISEPAINDDLMNFEKSQVRIQYKIGVLYCADGQTTEREMFGNSAGSEDFEEFISFLGDKILLSRFQGFRGGLSNQYDGTHSVYSKWGNFEVMFHVSTLLSHTPTDREFVEKKRHIGNDCVVVLFKEDSSPFNPQIMKSQFTHVYILVQKVTGKDGNTQYKVGVASKEHVPPYEPHIPYPPIFEKGEQFRDFLFTKMINAERASSLAPDFLFRNIRSRKALLSQMFNKFMPSK